MKRYYKEFQKRLELCGCWLLAALLVYLFCGSLLTGNEVIGFRDSVYLYYPLMQWLNSFPLFDFPLWNPYCNLGMPVVGDGTSCAWYPGRLFFYLPGLSFDSRYGLFLTAHLVLAGGGAFWLARIFSANPAGAMLAAVSYGLGGCVLTQMSNMIYLISAAWLPIALGSIWLMYQKQDFRWSLIAGCAGACIILGGDPQLVYHLGMIATATGVWFWLAPKKDADARGQAAATIPSTSGRSFIGRWLLRSIRPLGLLLLFVITTSLLAGAQIYASWEWSQHSQRFSADQNFGLAESTTDSQTFHAYQFSLTPWSLAELWWSNASGRTFPIHQRWTDGLPGADRVWYPSIYLGLATFWIAVGQIRFRGLPKANVWLTWIGLLFGVASFGWYGAVWWINECLPASYRIVNWPPETGGLYWVLYQFFPFYSSFRYPAKLFLITSLCLSVLAGVGLNENNRLISLRWGFTLIFISIAVAISLAIGSWNHVLDRVAPDPLFGPFDIDGCKRGLYRSFASSIVIIGVLMLIQTQVLDRNQHAPKRRWLVVAGLWLIVCLTSLDLTLANRWLLAKIPSSVMHGKVETPISEKLLEKQIPLVSVYRSVDRFVEPSIWAETSSHTRLAEVATWQRQTLHPKNHLSHAGMNASGIPIRLLGSFSSIWPEQYERLLDQLGAEVYVTELNSEFPDQSNPRPNSLDSLVNLVIHSDGRTLETVMLDRATKIVSLQPLSDGSEKESEHERRGSGANDLLEDDSIPDEDTFSASVEIESFACDRIELLVNSEEQCRLVHHCFYDGKWRAVFIHPSRLDQPPLEPMGLGQGIDLPSGRTRLALIYQPTGYRYSVLIMLGSWVVWLLAMVWVSRTGK